MGSSEFSENVLSFCLWICVSVKTVNVESVLDGPLRSPSGVSALYSVPLCRTALLCHDVCFHECVFSLYVAKELFKIVPLRCTYSLLLTAFSPSLCLSISLCGSLFFSIILSHSFLLFSVAST